MFVERIDAALDLNAVADNAAGRVPVHPAERLRRENQIAVSAGPEQSRPHREQAGFGVDFVRRQVERGPDVDVPETVDGPARLSEAPEQLAERLTRIRLRGAQA